MKYQPGNYKLFIASTILMVQHIKFIKLHSLIFIKFLTYISTKINWHIIIILFVNIHMVFLKPFLSVKSVFYLQCYHLVQIIKNLVTRVETDVKNKRCINVKFWNCFFSVASTTKLQLPI